MELLLHYVWKHKIFPLKMLQTTTGEPVEVILPYYTYSKKSRFPE